MMLRLACFAVLVGAVAGQAVLTTDSNNRVQVTRQVTTDLADIDLRIERAVSDAQIAAERAAYAATTNATVTMFQSMQAIEARLASQMASLDARFEAQGETLSSQVSTIASSLTASTADATASLATAMQSTSTELTRSASTSAAAVDAQISQALVSVSSSLDSMNSSVVASLTSKADSKVHMWSGGCSNRAGGGWHEYCLNQAHVNTMAPKFRIATSTRFAAVVRGYYSINYWVAYMACSWQHQLIYVSGSHKVHGYQRQGYHEGGHSWRDSHAYIQWPIQAGQQFWGRTYAGCWHAWHSTNSGGAHSRITVVYEGTIA